MSSMNSEIKDKAYHEELVREIEIKEARSLLNTPPKTVP